MKPWVWFVRGDWNAFFGLVIDNLAVLVTLFTILTFADAPNGYTPEFVLTRMLPGTALGVFLGDLVYTWMAIRLAKKQKRDNVTAMPLGLDTPSTFGMAFLVLLPALAKGNELFPGNHEKAMMFGWQVGLSVLVAIGLMKCLFSPFGNLVRKWIPRAGLLGGLAAIALTLIAFMPMKEDIGGNPLIGLPCLFLILITLLAHRRLPWGIPGALGALLLGLFLYFGAALLGQGLIVPPIKEFSFQGHWAFQLPVPFLASDSIGWANVFQEVLHRIPIVFPFALATVIGGIDCTESAASEGDEFDTRSILFTEAATSLVAGFFGGVIQTTPYIGQPAYKKMGGRAGYTLLTALFIGLAGFLGGFTVLFHYLPRVVLFPILVFVGLEITSHTFRVVPPRHFPAVAFSILPALAYLALLTVKSLFGLQAPLSPEAQTGLQTLRCLANGFLISGMLWATILAFVQDGKMVPAAVYCLVTGGLAFFGIIHSPLGDEMIGLPWHILAQVDPKMVHAVQYQTPYHWALGYFLCALLIFLLRRSGSVDAVADGGSGNQARFPQES